MGSKFTLSSIGKEKYRWIKFTGFIQPIQTQHATALVEITLFAGITSWKAHAAVSGLLLPTAHGDLGNILLLGILGCLIALLRSRARRMVFLGCVVLSSMLVFTDIVHYRAFHDFAIASELGEAGQLPDVFTGIFPYIRPVDLWLIADWPIWIYLLTRRQDSGNKSPRFLASGCVAASFLFAFAYTFNVSALIIGRTDETIVNNRVFAVIEVGVLNFHVLDLVDLLASKTEHKSIPQEQLARVERSFSTQESTGKESVPFGAAHGFNVIFILVESLEAFTINFQIDGQELTPTLNRLATNGCYLNRFFPQNSLGTTSDAQYCVLNSLLPAGSGVVARQYLNNTFWALPSILKGQGYRTLAFGVCRPNLWNTGRMHRAYGFERRFYYDDFANPPEHFLKISDDRFFSKVGQILRQQRQPFFAHLMTISSHTPFQSIPAEKKTMHLGHHEGTVLGDYLHAIHFADAALGGFLEGLKADGFLTNSVIVIYGDHQALPDDEWKKTAASASDAVGLRLDQYFRRRVPAFILSPGGLPAGTFDRPSGQIDLAPTVLHLLGIPRTRTFFLGENIFQDGPPLVYLRTGAFYDGKQFFLNVPGQTKEGSGMPAFASDCPDSVDCNRDREKVLERVQLSDEILEHDLLSILLKRLPRGY